LRKSDLELLRPLWAPSSLISDEDCKQSLKLWLMEGNYYVNSTPPGLSLYCQVPDEIKKSLSLDAFRFAAHSAQTVFELEKTSAYTKFTSWRVIQAYYAAYFAAHAILRFFGKSFSHLENGHVNFLKERCHDETGYTPDLSSTYYLITYSPKDQELSFLRRPESHKDLWRCFEELLRNISKETLSVTASEQRRKDLSKIFSDLADALNFRGKHPAGNWLSVVRNDVNYKSQHGAWFPFSKTTPSFEDLMAKVKDWRKGSNDSENPNLIKNDLERFFITAFSIVDLALSIGFDYQDIIDKSGRRSADFSRLIKVSAAG
jgi:hypothetical protein